jgi:hypothetical protein
LKYTEHILQKRKLKHTGFADECLPFEGISEGGFHFEMSQVRGHPDGRHHAAWSSHPDPECKDKVAFFDKTFPERQRLVYQKFCTWVEIFVPGYALSYKGRKLHTLVDI